MRINAISLERFPDCIGELKSLVQLEARENMISCLPGMIFTILILNLSKKGYQKFLIIFEPIFVSTPDWVVGLLAGVYVIPDVRRSVNIELKTLFVI